MEQNNVGTEPGGTAVRPRQNGEDAVPEPQQREQNNAEWEERFYQALCVDYTAAYCCDLISDEMTLIKQKNYSHSAASTKEESGPHCFSEWIRYTYENVVIRELSPDYLEQFNNANLMERLRREESFVYRHKTHPNKRGMQYFEARVVRLAVDAQSFKVILGYRPIDDIVAEELKTQRKLEQAVKAAQEASNAKSAFLFNMSHDIRTPMNAIIGYTELLKKNGADADRRNDYIAKIEASSQYLLALLNDVLEMARIESGKVTLDETLENARVIMDDLICVFENMMQEKHITFRYEAHVQHEYLYCDVVKVKEVMLNILSNAFKYTLPGGCIDYQLDELPSDRPGVSLFRAVVKDNGIGMSEAFLATIFDSFTRERTSTESGQNGTGLGMAITKKLIELMGGTIEIESAPGCGTTVTATFPHRIGEKPQPDTVHGLQKTALLFEGRRVLLAEDNDLNAEIAEELLEMDGLAVERARDGIECIGMLEQRPAGYYDLILMDIQMPHMDGYKATSVIRNLADPRLAGIPIIAMTANAFDEDRKKALRTGMNAHIAKPMDLQKLEKTIRELLQNR